MSKVFCIGKRAKGRLIFITKLGGIVKTLSGKENVDGKEKD